MKELSDDEIAKIEAYIESFGDVNSRRQAFWQSVRKGYPLARELDKKATAIWEHALSVCQDKGVSMAEWIASLEPWEQDVLRNVMERGTRK